jgi:alpha-galactosidase/6-phospho-beta-glucosidase family protein
MFTVNHNEASSFEPLPEGDYEVVISETKVDKSKEKQTPFVGMTMTVRDEADINPVGRKRKIFHNMYYTEKTVGMFQALFKALLFDNGKQMASLEDVAKEIKGCTVRVRLKHEKYQDAQGNTKTAERVHYFSQSQKPLSRALLTNDPFAANANTNNNGFQMEDMSDDDLPF